MNPVVKTIRNKQYINEKRVVNLGKYQSLYKLNETINELIQKYGESSIIYFGWHSPYKCTIFYKRMETDEEFIIRVQESGWVKTKDYSIFNYIADYFRLLVKWVRNKF